MIPGCGRPARRAWPHAMRHSCACSKPRAPRDRPASRWSASRPGGRGARSSPASGCRRMPRGAVRGTRGREGRRGWGQGGGRGYRLAGVSTSSQRYLSHEYASSRQRGACHTSTPSQCSRLIGCVVPYQRWQFCLTHPPPSPCNSASHCGEMRSLIPPTRVPSAASPHDQPVSALRALPLLAALR
jgi:hypothetical protein